MYFVLGMLIKIDSWGRYGFLYFLFCIWLLEFVSGRVRDRFDDLYIVRECNSMFDNIFFNKCYIINMFNFLNIFFD